MNKPHQPTIALGVTGSIAAYKAADLTSRLVKKGYNVIVIMTDNAQKLIGAPTFLSLSRNPVITSLFEIPDWKPGHIDLSAKTDLFVVAPATANILAKITYGIADDALSTALLSCTAPILVAPAMNPAMWNNVAVVENVAKLRSRGIHFVGPSAGMLACGDQGTGRMSEPADIVEYIEKILPIPSK